MLDAERKLAEERLVQLTGAQAEVQAVHQKHAEMETSLQQARAEVLQMRTSRDHYQDSRDQAAAQIVQLRKQSAELEEELRTIQEAMRGMTAQLDQQDRTGDAGAVCCGGFVVVIVPPSPPPPAHVFVCKLKVVMLCVLFRAPLNSCVFVFLCVYSCGWLCVSMRVLWASQIVSALRGSRLPFSLACTERLL